MSAHAIQRGSGTAVAEPLGCFPVALKLKGKPCLLIGSAPETALRARQLLEAEANLTIVSPAANAELRSLAATRNVPLEERHWCESDLIGRWLIVMTDQNHEEATRLGQLCTENRTFFCAIDDPDPSSFSHVAIARAGALWAAIGTAGKAPALASRMRQELQRLFDESNLGTLVQRFADLRTTTSRNERRAVLLRAAANVSIIGKIVERTEEIT